MDKIYRFISNIITQKTSLQGQIYNFKLFRDLWQPHTCTHTHRHTRTQTILAVS